MGYNQKMPMRPEDNEGVKLEGEKKEAPKKSSKKKQEE